MIKLEAGRRTDTSLGPADLGRALKGELDLEDTADFLAGL